MEFPISGVEVFPLVPPLVAFGISLFTSMGGVTGAFLLLPFQISILGFTSPAVSATNLVYNLTAIPGGVYRTIREGRMNWPVGFTLLAGSLPGMFAGILIRIHYLPDPGTFKFFAGCVLLYVGGRLLLGARSRGGTGAPGSSRKAAVKIRSFSLRRLEYTFNEQVYSVNPAVLLGISAAVGVVSGVYGIGGGALVAPILVAVLQLPVYSVTGACLFFTFVNSGAGALFYAFLASILEASPAQVAPDWLLGLFFGAGGFLGIYCGTRLQKHVPEKAIKLILGLCILFVAVRYLGGAWSA